VVARAALLRGVGDRHALFQARLLLLIVGEPFCFREVVLDRAHVRKVAVPGLGYASAPLVLACKGGLLLHLTAGWRSVEPNASIPLVSA
jgi:hypothetical protein